MMRAWTHVEQRACPTARSQTAAWQGVHGAFGARRSCAAARDVRAPPRFARAPAQSRSRDACVGCAALRGTRGTELASREVMSSRLSLDTILDRLAERGLTEDASARAALHATLAVMGERLVEDEARALAEVLPDELAMLVAANDYDGDFDDAELFERVSRRAHERSGRAREEAEIVLAVLGDCLGAERRRRIARGLPSLAAQLLEGERERGVSGVLGVSGVSGVSGMSGEDEVSGEGEGEGEGELPPYAEPRRAPRVATVASSRPGSTHPLSESAPPAGHTHSVARNPSPHEETKLSASKGLTQERFDETLGTGRAPR